MKFRVEIKLSKVLPDGTIILATEVNGCMILSHLKIKTIDFKYKDERAPPGTVGWDYKTIESFEQHFTHLQTKVMSVSEFIEMAKSDTTFGMGETPLLGNAPLLEKPKGLLQ